MPLELVTRPENEEPVLRTERLTTDLLTPNGAVRVVDCVDITVRSGETLGIVGESGSGKSILLRSVMGLLRAGAAKIDGSVRISGTELVGLPRGQLRRLWGQSISIVFQDPMTSLNPVMRIGRQITEAIAPQRGRTKEERARRAVELLEAVGIPEPGRRLRQYPHELSGGMRQRVAIAIALASDPALLLADEPTTALDVTVQAQILDMLAHLRLAMVLVSHDLGVIANRADAIAVMYAGQVVEMAPTSQIFWATRHPYTEALIRSIPRTDQPSHTRLHTIGGRPPDLARPPSGCRFAPRCGYAQDRCRTEEPALLASEDDPDHLYRCWYPIGHDTPRKGSHGAAESAAVATDPADERERD